MTVLKPRLVSMSAEQRRDVPKLGDANQPFVDKVMHYAKNNPEFAPAYMDIPEMEIDLNAVDSLTDIFRPLQQLIQQLDDSILLSGSEAYIASLAYYNSVKIASRMKIAGAKVVYEDLKQNFARGKYGPRDSSESQA